MIEQLLKKNKLGEYEKMYPITLLEAIRLNSKSNRTLEDILKDINHLYIPWQGVESDTLLSVDPVFRKKGLWITYVDCSGSVITMWYNSDDLSDTAWENIDNWVEYRSIRELQNTLKEILSWWYDKNGG